MMRFGESSVTWVFAQQAVSRLLVAFKFFLLARLLGPQSIGLIAACLMALSIAESLTEMGMSHALIQRRELLDQRGLDALWTATALRGLLLTVVLFAASGLIARLMNIPEGTAVLQMVALVPLARCIASVRVVIAQRERRFRTVALLTSSFVVVDFVMSAVAALTYRDVFWVLAALPLSEFLKAIASYIVFKTKPRLNFDTKPLGEVMEFGRWVWASSLLTVVVNQLDRIITVKTFGVQTLGLYQTASRLAQFGVADFGIAMSQYLFPNFSELARRDKSRAAHYALALFSQLGTIALVVATFLCVAARDIIQLALGGQWSGAVPFFRIFVYLMAAGVLVGLLTSYLRGTGRPSRVTRATVVQLACLLASSAILVPWLGPIGVAFAATISVFVCAALMLWDVVSDDREQIRQLLPLATVGVPVTALIVILGQVFSSFPYHAVGLGFVCAVALVLPLQRLRAGISLTVQRENVMRIMHVVLTPRHSGAEMLAATLAEVHTSEKNGVAGVMGINPCEAAFRPVWSKLEEKGVWCASPARLLGRLGRLRFIRATLREFRPDVIVAHSVIPAAYARLAMKLTTSAIPVVTVMHAATNDDYAGGLLRLSERILKGDAAAVVTVTETAANNYRSRCGAPRRLLTIPNGTDLDRFAFDENARRRLRTEFKVDDSVSVVLQVGRLSPVKNQAASVLALNDMLLAGQSVELWLAGLTEDPSYGDALKRLVEQHGLSGKVRFLGSRPDVAALLCAADVYVMPSGREAHSVAMIEALASGVPIVASAIPVFGFATHFSGVVTVDPASHRDYAASITKVLAQAKIRHQRDLSAYSIERVAERYAALFGDVTSRPSFGTGTAQEGAT
jgi:O-antigen/teichoic acid export membrane protein/glycosyltransferase involved in cell wall biosynthesis